MARIFKSRATAGRLFLSGTMANFTAVGDITDDAFRGDGDAGTFAVPAVGDVRDGTFYGAGGTEYEGTLAGGGGYTYGDEDPAFVLTTADGAGTYQPVAASDVQEGVAVGVAPTVGTFVVPAESDVRLGVEYGHDAEFTGTLVVTVDYSSVTEDAGRVQQICEALKLLLDAADGAEAFYETLGATRVYATLSDLTEVGDSVVAVIAPQLTTRARDSNGSYGRYVVIDILVRIHLTGDASVDRTTMDNRVYLLEQIDNYLAAEANNLLTLPDSKLAEYVEPTDTRADSDIREGLGVLWVSDDLLDKRQVTGIVRVAYWVDEDY